MQTDRSSPLSKQLTPSPYPVPSHHIFSLILSSILCLGLKSGQGGYSVFLLQSTKAYRGNRCKAPLNNRRNKCGWVVNVMHRPLYSPGWAPEPVWTFRNWEKSLPPIGFRTPDHPYLIRHSVYLFQVVLFFKFPLQKHFIFQQMNKYIIRRYN